MTSDSRDIHVEKCLYIYCVLLYVKICMESSIMEGRMTRFGYISPATGQLRKRTYIPFL